MPYDVPCLCCTGASIIKVYNTTRCVLCAQERPRDLGRGAEACKHGQAWNESDPVHPAPTYCISLQGTRDPQGLPRLNPSSRTSEGPPPPCLGVSVSSSQRVDFCLDSLSDLTRFRIHSSHKTHIIDHEWYHDSQIFFMRT